MYVRHNKMKEPNVSSDEFLLILLLGLVIYCLPAFISYFILNKLLGNKVISIIISVIIEIVFIILTGN